MIGIIFVTLEGPHYSEIWSNIGTAILGRNFDVTIGRAAYVASSATWNLGTKSAFALRPTKTTENIDRVDRSQNLPDGISYANPNISPYLAVALFEKKNAYLFLHTLLLYAYFGWAPESCV
jgi:hypothetical protein